MALGDARLSLERESPQNFDVLAVDAFSSDAIPVHLLTREAFALYFQHLKPTRRAGHAHFEQAPGSEAGDGDGGVGIWQESHGDRLRR